MNSTTRIYLDAFLQNIKSVTFFLFLPVLIARLGASPFEIALSNSLPALFCAFSLAFITRQLPLTYSVYYGAGMIRQICFLCMAISPLLPNPVFWLLFFWVFNAMSVMVTSVQQQALYRHAIEEKYFSTVLSRIKVISIIIGVLGSFLIGKYLDIFQYMFPYNYVISMVIGAVATFAGMSLMAKLAPKEKKPIRFHIVRPLRTYPRSLMAITIATASIAVMGPLWTVYHVNELQMTNFQIGIFGIAAGIVSTLIMPLLRRGLEKWKEGRIIFFTALVMAVIPLIYGFVSSFWLLVVFQVLMGISFSYYDLSQQSLALREAKEHQEDELTYFSDYQLVQNISNGVAPLLTGFLMAFTSVQITFVVLGIMKFVSVFAIATLFGIKLNVSKKQKEVTV